MRRRTIFVNRFFHPDHSATAQILSDVAQHLAAEGFPVSVIASRTLYSGAAGALAKRETWQGVEIHRAATTRFGRSALPGRACDYATFYMSSFLSVLKHARKGDMVIAKTDPPLLGVTVGLAARLKRARRGNWFQDLYPEVAEAAGLKLPGPVLAGLRWMRRRSVAKADLNVTIGRRMAVRLEDEAVGDPGSIRVIHNFSDDEALRPDPPGWRTLRSEWGFCDDDVVIGYSGNLGRAHDVDTILSAARTLRDEPRYKFLFIGGGHSWNRVEAACSDWGLQNVFFRPYQPRARIAHSLSVPDLHWISLQPAYEGLIVPSKLYGVASVGRPVIMIGAGDGEIGRLLKTHHFGETVAPGDVQALVSCIRRLGGNQAALDRMGRAARAFVDEEASRGRAFQRWRDELAAVLKPK